MAWWWEGWWALPLLCLGMMALCLWAARRGRCCGMGHRGSQGSSDDKEG